MKELLEELNNNYSDEKFEEYYEKIYSYLEELWSLLSDKNKPEEVDQSRIEFLKSELSSIGSNEKFYDYPYYLFIRNGFLGADSVGADSIEDLQEQGINLDDGFVVEIYDTLSEIILKKSELFIDIEYFKTLLEGKHLVLESKDNTNAPDNKDTYHVNYENIDAIFEIQEEMLENYGDPERGKIVSDMFGKHYGLDTNYMCLINNYKKNGNIDKESILIHLLKVDKDLDAIKKYLKDDFNQEDLQFYFERIKKSYQNEMFKEMIDRLCGSANKFMGVELFSEIKSFFDEKQKKDLVVIDILRNPNMVNFIDEGIKNYNQSNAQEQTNASIDDIINLTSMFYKAIDPSGNLDNKLYELLNNNKIIIYEEEQRKDLEKEYNITLTGDSYHNKCDKIFIKNTNSYNMFIILVHEMMHYISFMKGNGVNDQIQEFPSIYFEYLAERFAETMNISANHSKLRVANSKSLYDSLKTLASINIDEFKDENGKINYDELQNYLIERNGSENYIDDFILDCYEILYNQASSVCFSYVFSSALTEYCFRNKIDPMEIYDVCVNLSDFNNADELLSRLNIDLDNTKTNDESKITM